MLQYHYDANYLLTFHGHGSSLTLSERTSGRERQVKHQVEFMSDSQLNKAFYANVDSNGNVKDIDLDCQIMEEMTYRWDNSISVS